MRTFHRDSGYDAVADKPPIPSGGLGEAELAELSAELGVALPGEYRLLLSNWRYLDFLDGCFSIWDPTEGDGPAVLSGFRGSDHRFLQCGSCSRRADGDPLMIDLDDPSHPAVVWCHDEIVLEPLAPSLSLGIYRIMEYLAPADSYQLAVDAVRESIRLGNLPWWKKIFI